jgi:hypothetical protein
MARCRRWQAAYDAQTNALLFGQPNRVAGHICEPDPHRWMHKSMDCTLQESRLDRLLCRARDKLLLLQKLRRNNLIAGAVETELIFWPTDSPPSHAVSTSRDGAIGKDDERTALDVNSGNPPPKRAAPHAQVSPAAATDLAGLEFEAVKSYPHPLVSVPGRGGAGAEAGRAADGGSRACAV